MAKREKKPIEVIHVFMDGTVSHDVTVKKVPRELVLKVHEIVERIEARRARERAEAESRGTTV